MSHPYRLHGASADPELMLWIKARIRLPYFQPKLHWTEEHDAQVSTFLLSSSLHKLILYLDPDLGLVINALHTATLKRITKLAFFVKTTPAAAPPPPPSSHPASILPPSSLTSTTADPTFPTLTLSNISSIVYFGTFDGSLMDSLLRQMSAIYLPSFLASSSWPDSVKKDLTTALHRFMASLTESTHQARGHTVLYLPDEPPPSPDPTADKDYVQRLESSVIHWTRQIKEVVSNVDYSHHAEASGPLEEVDFWRRRTVDLSGIRQQLEREGVKRIVAVLHTANSSYLTPFSHLALMIQQGSREANNNLLFLSTLEAPCQQLAAARPADIPALLPTIANLVRMIWTHSGFYNTEERLTGLLRKVSNQIIAQCSASIQLGEIFDGDVLGSMVVLQQSIRCGAAWHAVYEQTCRLIERDAKCTSKWRFDPSTHGIFAQLDAFSQRCHNLLEVCEGQLQFARKNIFLKPAQPTPTDASSPPSDPPSSTSPPSPPGPPTRAILPVFGGHNGSETEKSLAEIEATFEASIAQLRALDYDVCNVRATSWHYDYATFKNTLKDLEVMLANVMGSAWECVASVSAGVELLEHFHSLAVRPAMKASLDRKVLELFAMFANEVKRVKTEFDRHKKDPPLTAGQPRYAGAALWAKSLLARVEVEYFAIVNAAYLCTAPQLEEAKKLYVTVEGMIEGYVRQQHSEWVETVQLSNTGQHAASLSQRLQRPLMIRADTKEDQSLAQAQVQSLLKQSTSSMGLRVAKSGHLEVNFDHHLLKLFNEVRYWDRFHGIYPIPYVAYEMYQHQDSLRIVREAVMLVVRDYNTIVDALPADDRRLFTEHLRRVDRKISPGLAKLTWNEKHIKDWFVTTCREQCGRVYDIVTQFKANHAAIVQLCQHIAELVTVDIEPNTVYDDAVFEERQRAHQTLIRAQLEKAHEHIAHILQHSYTFFHEHGPDIQAEWRRYVRKTDARVEEALRLTVKKSLQEMGKAINGDHKSKSEAHPLFRVNMVLDEGKGKVEFRPSVKDLAELIQQISKESIRTIQVVPRLQDMLEGKERKKGVQEEEKTQLSDASAVAPSAASLPSFFDVISGDEEVLKTFAHIMHGTSNLSVELTKLITHYDRYAPIWNTDKAAFIRRYANTKRPLSSFDLDITRYKNNQSDIQSEDVTHGVGFIKVDCSLLKAALVSHCHAWVNKLTNLLHHNASTELHQLHAYFSDNSHRLSQQPLTLEQLSDSLALLKQTQADLQSFQARFTPCEEMFKCLDKFDFAISEEEKELVDALKLKGIEYVRVVAEADTSLKAKMVEMKRELEEGLLSFTRHVADLRNEFKDKAPFATVEGRRDDAAAAEDKEAGGGEGVKEEDSMPDVGAAFLVLSEYRVRLKEQRDKAEGMKKGIALFSLKSLDLSDLDECERELVELERVWSLIREWEERFARWRGCAFFALNLDEMDAQAQAQHAQLSRMAKHIRQWRIHKTITAIIHKFRLLLPVIADLRSHAMRARHWEAIQDEMGLRFDMNSMDFHLDDFYRLNLFSHAELIHHVASVALRELGVEKQLKEISGVWEGGAFKLNDYKGRYRVIAEVDDINDDLESHQLLLSTMKNSPYYATFAAEVNYYAQLCNDISEMVELLTAVQKAWKYLESIFVDSLDIKRQLPSESNFFHSVHTDWLGIIAQLQEEGDGGRIINLLSPAMMVKLNKMHALLERINHSLNDYLEKKRQSFARFYWLSNEDLLEILGLSKEPLEVNQHIRKLFTGVQRLDIRQAGDGSSWEVVGLFSAEGEHVRFLAPVQVEGDVETWLQRVELAISECLQKHLYISITHINKVASKKSALEHWVRSSLGQLLILSSQIGWTAKVTAALNDLPKNRKSLKKVKAEWHDYLSKLAKYVRSDALDELERLKLLQLITVEVHARDVIDRLRQVAKARERLSVHSFEWMSQLRFYFVKEQGEYGSAVIKQTNTSFTYRHEYICNEGRLVITPLTDRCFITLTIALHLALGGSPVGPAGTGKTETVKDLAKNLGQCCIIYNGSEQMTVESLTRQFSGLAQTGAWGCFDEFNRISIEVLSVIALTVSSIFAAVRAHADTLTLDSQHVRLNRSMGLFITMNPGYAGRTELPDNLSSLFRPVAMIAPDTELITEILLQSEGFKEAALLSKKLISLYSLIERQLSKQSHYAYGLRNIKAVLDRAGHLIRQKENGELTEELILMRALREGNASKLIRDDLLLFDSLLSDVFPNLELPVLDYAQLTGEMERQLKAQQLTATPALMEKMIQLYETKLTRHGIMLVGAAQTGKSCAWKTLAAALTVLAERGVKGVHPVDVSLLNPKAITTAEMFGRFTSDGEWRDGVLASLMRRACTSPPDVERWILIDGPVDTLWIESLNCFPADDHELLTAHGFMTLAQVQAHFTQHPTLEVACYTDHHLEYHAVTADKLTINTGDHEIVDMKSQGHVRSAKKGGKGKLSPTTNGVDISPTRNHRMFGVCRPTRMSASGRRKWTNETTHPVSWATHTAGKILAAGRRDDTVVYQLQAGARGGLLSDEDDWPSLPFVAPLGLQSLDQVAAFLQLYGYWLGDGHLGISNRSVCFAPVKAVDIAYLDGLFARLPSLPLLAGQGSPRGREPAGGGAGYYKNNTWRNGQTNYVISHRAWWDFFAQQYGHKYKGYWARVGALEGALRRKSDVPVSRYADLYPTLPYAQVEGELRRLLLEGPRHGKAEEDDSDAEEEAKDAEERDEPAGGNDSDAEEEAKDEQWGSQPVPPGWKVIPFEHMQPERDIERPLADDDSEAGDTETDDTEADDSGDDVVDLTEEQRAEPDAKRRRISLSSEASASPAPEYCPYVPGQINQQNIDQILTVIKTSIVTEPPPPDAEDIKSAKWAAYWARTRLGKSLVRQLISGLKFADGHQKPGKQHRTGKLKKNGVNLIGTSSARFKEELIQLLLHAGYTVRSSVAAEPGQACGVNQRGVPIIARHHHFSVYYARFTETRAARPRLVVKHETRARLWTGTVWCVTVPTRGQRILFRKVTRRENGVVLEASRPVVVGNTVLDDTKVLTLINGDRISLPSHVRLMFEVEDLAVASPATVSRCGMVYFDHTTVGWRPLVQAWLSRKMQAVEAQKVADAETAASGQPAVGARYNMSKEGVDLLGKLLEKYAVPALAFKLNPVNEMKEVLPLSEVQSMQTLTRLFDCVATADNGVDCALDESNYMRLLELQLTFAVVWSIGATLDDASRIKFDIFVRDVEAQFPPLQTVYEYYVDGNKKDWALWEEKVNNAWRPSPATPFHRILVPTIDTVRHSFLLSTLLKQRTPTLVIGGTGTGKTSVIDSLLHDLDPLSLSLTLTFSAATSAELTQEMIESRLEKRQRGSYGPQGAKQRLILFIDDLNLPRHSEYGSVPVHELMRQWLDYGFWYDRSKQSRRTVVDMQLLAAMGLVGGARAPVSARLQSKMAPLHFVSPAEAQVKRIFRTLIVNHFSDFDEPIKPLGLLLTQATLDVYRAVSSEFLPVPASSHYLFNLRDLSKVVYGLLQSASRWYDSRESVLRLWVHECMRVFSDRLVSEGEREKLVDILNSKLHTQFETNWKKLFKDHRSQPLFTNLMEEEITATTVVKQGGEEDVEERRPYIDVTNKQAKLRGLIEEQIASYNQVTHHPCDLVMFDSAVEHLTRIHRILTQPRGSALLIGMGGSGRSSLVRLCCHINRFVCKELVVGAGYRMADFHGDVKDVYLTCGMKQQTTVLLVNDSQLVHEEMLEDLNAILTSGEIPKLFPAEELTPMLEELRTEASRAGRPTSTDALYSFFIERVRNHLHVVLCLSPVGGEMRNRLRMFPALVNCCSIDWYSKWPTTALTEVAARLLKDTQLAAHTAGSAAGGAEQAKSSAGLVATNNKLKEQLAAIFPAFHQAAVDTSSRMSLEIKRHHWVTPTKYLDLIQGYKLLMRQRVAYIEGQAEKLRAGLEKLESSGEQVKVMTLQLEEKKKTVASKKLTCDKLLVEIVQKQRAADEQKKQVELDAARTEVEAKDCESIKHEAQDELDKVLPALDKAVKALERLSKSAVTEVKSYQKPPKPVERVMCAVMTVMDKEPSWAMAKKELNDANFLYKLKEFDKDKISNTTLKAIQKYTKSHDFNPEDIGNVSQAAGALCEWVIAMEMYAKVFRDVEPRRIALRKAEESLKTKQTELEDAETQLREVRMKVSKLEETFGASENEQNVLRKEAEALEAKLKAAAKLVDGLSSEKGRWEQSIRTYQVDLKNLMGDCAIASAFIAYAGPFPAQYRDALMRKCIIPTVKRLNVPATPNFSLSSFLASDNAVREWGIEGLPTDSFSVENGVLVAGSLLYHWPLLIDPQEQGKRWIKKRTAAQGLEVIDPGMSPIARSQVLERALSCGMPLLVQDIGEELDPLLDEVLRLNLLERPKDRAISVTVGKKDILCHPSFHLYLTTKLHNPSYSPEVALKTSIINFSVIELGLQNQLLGLVVRMEEPKLEADKHHLTLSITQNKRQLMELEDEILDLLSHADKGSLLEDEVLITALTSSKEVSESVKTKLSASAVTEGKIDAAREQYRSCAVRASVCFFTLNELAAVDPMYQFSMQAYLSLFEHSIKQSRLEGMDGKGPRAYASLGGRGGGAAMNFDEASGPPLELLDRINQLNDFHTTAVYHFGCHALFDKHRLLFAFRLCLAKLRSEDKLDDAEYDFFLRGGQVFDRSSRPVNPCGEWLSEVGWDHMCELSKLPTFNGLLQSFESNAAEWKAWYRSEEPMPERLLAPFDWNQNSTGALSMKTEKRDTGSFQHLLLLRCLRPDRVVFAARQFISTHLGPQFAESPTVELADVAGQMTATTPLIFILSPGVDPTAAIQALATQQQRTMQLLALGQGQTGVAMKMLQAAMAEGHWLYLANLHLSIRWLPELDKLIESLPRAVTPPHPHFRLFLSSNPHPHFPISLLQSSIKITTEPPRGLKANMLRLYSSFTDAHLSRSHRPERYRRLLFALVFFHAVVVERRKFGSLGWTQSYAFNDGDLQVSDSLLSLYVNEYDDTPWEALRYLIAQCNYGGRVTEPQDRRVLDVYATQMFHEGTLAPHFTLSTLDTYHIPDDCVTLEQFRAFIHQLPNAADDPPEAFGQHSNADIASQMEETRMLLSSILTLQPKVVVEGGRSREEVVLDLIATLADTVPKPFDLLAVKAKYGETERAPLTVVLLQEVERYNGLLSHIHQSMADLVKGIKGLALISPELECMFDSLYHSSVPLSWQHYPSLKPLGSWARDLFARIAQLKRWHEEELPKVFWLGGLMFPTGFLTALLQQTARRGGVGIEALSWEWTVMTTAESAVVSRPKDGAYIKGLYMEGARWDVDNACISEAGTMELYAAMPLVHFKPVEGRKKGSKGVHALPLYQYPVRRAWHGQETMLGELELKSGGKDSSFWTRRGVALLLSLEE